MKSPNEKIKNNIESLPPSLGFHDFIEDEKVSAIVKYQNLVIGDKNLWHLVKFELLTLILTNVPGILGFFLRQKLYGFIFKKLGKGVVFGYGVSLRQPGKISIGRSSIVDDMARLSVRGDEKAGIQLGENVFVGQGTILSVRNGILTIDEHASLGSYCRIAATNGTLKIGNYVLIAAYCYIGGGNHKTGRKDIPMARQGMETSGGVVIGDDVWIGTHSIISDGVKIGKGSIIGAGSFVNKDIPEYSIAFGSPAKVFKRRS